uniref:Hydroxcinnamoyl-CoA quinate/shikimate hydroxycinnamoyltransferase n=1 Tax=Rhizophora mucronata TaxID=61149 RepID=A0A2P2JLA5_RHIMU
MAMHKLKTGRNNKIHFGKTFNQERKQEDTGYGNAVKIQIKFQERAHESQRKMSTFKSREGVMPRELPRNS